MTATAPSVTRSQFLADQARRDVTFDGSFDVGSEANWIPRQPASISNSGTGSGFVADPDIKLVGTHSGRFTAGATDGTPGATTRSEILAYLGSTQGDDDYIAWATYWPSAPASWANNLQLFSREFTIANGIAIRFGVTYFSGSGPATGFFLTRNGSKTWQSPGGSETTHNLNVPIAVGSWHLWMLHVKWDTGTGGVIQVKHRLSTQATWSMVLNLTGIRTLQSRYDSGAEPATINIRHGLYRAEDTDIARTVYHDCFVRATSWDAAEQAFVATPSQPQRKISRVSRGTAAGEVATVDQVTGYRRRKTKGVWLPEGLDAAWTNATLANGTLYGFRFYNPEAFLVRKIKFQVQTAAGSDDPFDLVIFNADGTSMATGSLTPAPIVAAKQGLLNSAGLKSLTNSAIGGTDWTYDLVLAADTVYNVCLACSVGTTAAVLAGKTIGFANLADASGSGVGDREFFSKTSSYPIGSTLSSPVAASIVPALWLGDS